MKVVVGIPARLGSTRFSRKPLCSILGMPMIEHVYERAKAVLREEERPSLESLKELLADHEAGICAHPRHHARWGSTIASVIMSPKQRWMEVCWSNPCQNRYVRYTL